MRYLTYLRLIRKVTAASPDIQSLEVAIQSDEGKVDVAHKQYGPAIKNWITTMLGKAIDTSWQIEVSIAANLITTAFQNYYGFLK